MTEPLRLVVFDVDGTLVNSQVHILLSVRQAFVDCGLPEPDDADVLQGVGLSLPEYMARLAPEAPSDTHARLVARYKALSFERHTSIGAEAEAPFYPGMRDLLDQLRAQDHTLLATATGKSRRGLDRMIAHHGLAGYFQTTQVADDHPSKPHPSMLWRALSDTGVETRCAVMVGDTSFDMQMGRAAGLATIGVGWGYHAADRLDADRVVHSADALAGALTEWMESLR